MRFSLEGAMPQINMKNTGIWHVKYMRGCYKFVICSSAILLYKSQTASSIKSHLCGATLRNSECNSDAADSPQDGNRRVS